MRTNPVPSFDQAELQAVRDFLNATRDDLPMPAPKAPRQAATNTRVTVHHGITRARNRSLVRGKSQS
jgi:hypothetical protein